MATPKKTNTTKRTTATQAQQPKAPSPASYATQAKPVKVIPTGTNDIAMNVTSPKYSASAWYWKLCQGKVPRLLNVPGWEGVLIHTGNNPLQTAGCVLVGKNTKVGELTESKATFEKLYKKMKAAYDKGEKITVSII